MNSLGLTHLFRRPNIAALCWKKVDSGTAGVSTAGDSFCADGSWVLVVEPDHDPVFLLYSCSLLDLFQLEGRNRLQSMTSAL